MYFKLNMKKHKWTIFVSLKIKRKIVTCTNKAKSAIKHEFLQSEDNKSVVLEDIYTNSSNKATLMPCVYHTTKTFF